MEPKRGEEELKVAERRRKRKQSLIIKKSKRDPNLLYTPHTPVCEKNS